MLYTPLGGPETGTLSSGRGPAPVPLPFPGRGGGSRRFPAFPRAGAGPGSYSFSELGSPRLPGFLVAWPWAPKILTPVLPCHCLVQDQFEVIERHTQWGLDLLDRYVKFVKERTEVEQAYAKQLR